MAFGSVLLPTQKPGPGSEVTTVKVSALTGLKPVTGATLRSPQVELPLAAVVSLDEPPLLPHAASPSARVAATVGTPSLRICTNTLPLIGPIADEHRTSCYAGGRRDRTA